MEKEDEEATPKKLKLNVTLAPWPVLSTITFEPLAHNSLHTNLCRPCLLIFGNVSAWWGHVGYFQ